MLQCSLFLVSFLRTRGMIYHCPYSDVPCDRGGVDWEVSATAVDTFYQKFMGCTQGVSFPYSYHALGPLLDGETEECDRTHNLKPDFLL